MQQVLICEKCGVLYPVTYDGIRCGQRKCDGRLITIAVEITEYVREKERWMKNASGG